MSAETLDLRTADLEAFVEAFEAAHQQSDSTDLDRYIPAADHPSYLPILCELVRLDLEFSWRRRRPRPLQDYRDRFPRLFADAASLSAIAFEDYRLRLRAGQPVSPVEYERQWSVNTTAWPAVEVKETANQENQATNASRDVAGRPFEFPEPGQHFLDFQIVRELGRGAFSRVYLARQGDLANRQVVLKIGAGLVNESQSLAQLLHTHIVPIYSVHRCGDLQALCMPYVGATTLAEILRDRRNQASEPTAPPPPAPGIAASLRMFAGVGYVDAVLWIAARLADGLQHAHDHGILHRDLKPANILLTDEGQPMLLDFNLAEDIKLRLFSATEAIGGTLAYMAPEHLAALGGDAEGFVDVRSDLYALGVILYELLAGHHPFPAHSGPLDQTLIAMIGDRYRQPPEVRKWNTAVSPAVEAIVRHCLEPDPADRYQSARELKEDLERHLALLPLRHCREPALRERLAKWLRRHPRLLSGISIGVTAALVLTIVWPRIVEYWHRLTGR